MYTACRHLSMHMLNMHTILPCLTLQLYKQVAQAKRTDTYMQHPSLCYLFAVWMSGPLACPSDACVSS